MCANHCVSPVKFLFLFLTDCLLVVAELYVRVIPVAEIRASVFIPPSALSECAIVREFLFVFPIDI